MKNRITNLLLLALTVALAGGCTADDAGTTGDTYSDSDINRYRAVLPSRATLEAPSLDDTERSESTLRSALVGDPATYPRAVKPIVAGVNHAISGLVDLLDLITDARPTLYNSETQEFLWGPYPDRDSGIDGAHFSVFIKDNGQDSEEDFRYHYGFMRMMGRDLASATMVIFGGANPDPDNEEQGSGVTLWDFDASREFVEANGGEIVSETRGRFVAVYGRGPGEDDPNDDVTIVVAAFRSFVPDDNPDAAPADLDYLYGHVAGAEHTFDFVDVDAEANVKHSGSDAAESFQVRLAVLDSGAGRAEAMAEGGDIANEPAIDQIAQTECWSPMFAETFIESIAYGPDGAEVAREADGALEDCGPLFMRTLHELNVPTLEDIDPELMAALDHIGTNGLE